MTAPERELLRLLVADPVFRGLCARLGLAVATVLLLAASLLIATTTGGTR